jgi:hypothetical protein
MTSLKETNMATADGNGSEPAGSAARESTTTQIATFAVLFALLLAIVIAGVLFSPANEHAAQQGESVPAERPARATPGSG